MNIGEPWPDLAEAAGWVHRMQEQRHPWAGTTPTRRFDDVDNRV